MEKDFRELLCEGDRLRGFSGDPLMDHRQFNALDVGSGWFISIQASVTHYCRPRETLDDLTCYYQWEIALLRDGKLVRPPDGCPYANEWDPGDGPVAGYLATEAVQEIYEWLRVVFASPIERLLQQVENPEG